MSSHEITHLIHLYGLMIVFLATALQALGVPVPGGTTVALAGIDASTKRGLPVPGVVAAGALGAIVGATLAFGLGRWRGEPVLLRVGRLFRQKPERVQKLREQFHEHALAPLFIARFITGARNLAGLLAGASGMAFAPFFLVSAAAALAWSAIISLEYYFAGRALLGAPTWLQIILVIVGIAATIASFRLLRTGASARAKDSGETADAPE